jgi:hypothetical protein
MEGVDPEAFFEDYGRGAGQELQWGQRNGRPTPPKMHAAHSSSALVVNTFSAWRRDPAGLELLGLGDFEGLRFEAQCATGLKGIPPHLDVLCTSAREHIVGIESKCLEFLQPHRAQFSQSYDVLRSLKAARPYFDLIPSLRADPDQFVYLDAAQLIKHALGLANCFPARRPTLLYLFWEPSDWSQFSEFRAHRDEVERFACSVRNSGVEFAFASYPELWASWRNAGEPSSLQEHAQTLMERYNVSALG